MLHPTWFCTSKNVLTMTPSASSHYKGFWAITFFTITDDFNICVMCDSDVNEMNAQEFARFEFEMSFGRISYNAQPPSRVSWRCHAHSCLWAPSVVSSNVYGEFIWKLILWTMKYDILVMCMCPAHPFTLEIVECIAWVAYGLIQIWPPCFYVPSAARVRYQNRLNSRGGCATKKVAHRNNWTVECH